MATNGAAHPVVAAGPPLSLVVREKHRAYVAPFPYTVGTEGSPTALLPETREDVVFSADGSAFVGVEGVEQSIVVRDSITGAVVCKYGGADDEALPLKFNFVTFSPKGTCVLAWARPVPGSSQPNLVVCEARTGKTITTFFQKTFHLDHWPSLQWSDDEAVAARSVSNTVHFFDGADLAAGPTSKLHIPGVTGFALSRGPAPHSVSCFVAGKSGSPGRISLFQHPDQGGEELLQRSTFRADTVDFKWAPSGVACLALVSTNSDSSGKSYYGESEAYFLHVGARAHKRLELPQEGPTYDVGWSPSGKEFVVIYGFMPARATMFNDECEPVFDFGTGPRNTVSFSPHGKFLALAGFGSLAGAVQFWDKNKMKLVGSAHLSATTDHCWSPCSRYFLAVTTFPRLRVDNMIRVVRFDGRLIHEHKMVDTMLLQARFRPGLRSAYQDPKLTMGDMIGGPPVDPNARPDTLAPNSNGGTAGLPKRTGGAYRPPGARGTVAAFSLHRDVEAGKVDKATFMAKGGGTNDTAPVRRAGAARRAIPGLDAEEDEKDAAPSKAALKRKKKKEKERLAAEGGPKAERPAAAAASEPGEPTPVEELDTVEALSKRIKGLRKKLRQVDALKATSAAGGEAKMNVDQLEKLQSAPALLEQLSLAERRLASK
jgi:translation initiation factor 2A